MRQKAFKTFILGLLLTLGWTSQASALACDDLLQKTEMTMEAHAGHSDGAGQSMPKCHGCEKGRALHQTSAQCIKNLEKNSAFTVSLKVKIETAKAVPFEFLELQTRNNQIRGPDKDYTLRKPTEHSLITLGVQLQV